MKKCLLAFLLLYVYQSIAQVVITNDIEKNDINELGVFNIKYSDKDLSIPVPGKQIIDRYLMEDSLHVGSKAYRFAIATNVNIEFSKHAVWIEKGDTSYARLPLIASGATTLSLDFGSFYLPEKSELAVYNAIGTVAGPIKASENNADQTWGSPVFRGEKIWIEVKLPSKSRSELKLKVSNLSYGYRTFDVGKIFGFGKGGNCLVNNNVVCTPIGNGWEFSRNGVCLILNHNSTAICTGSMINNACNNNVPYILSANHCLTEGNDNVSQYKFVFQYWSPNCNPSQDDLNYIQFYGSTKKANANPSDFLLLQMNSTPDPSSGITYLGWDRSTIAATSGASLHHPLGDVMKVSTFNTTALRKDSHVWSAGQKAPGELHWIVKWDSGITQKGSSGAPLFNQNKRIVGQLSGGPSYCNAPGAWLEDAYGRFDNSWTGLGTNSTRLSNWLDPSNLGSTTTASIGISHISGSSFVCTTSPYSIVNLPAGTTVTSWSSSNPQLMTINANGLASRVGNGNGQVVISATLNNGCGNFTRTKTVFVGKPVIASISADPDVCAGESQVVVANMTGVTTFSWAITSGNASNAFLTDYNNGQVYFNTYIPDCYGLQISASNTCGATTNGTTICVSNCGGLIAYPNPAKHSVTLDFSGFMENNFPDKIHIYDDQSTELKKAIDVESGMFHDKKIKVNTEDLPRGIYLFHIIKNGKDREIEKIRIILE